MDFSSKAKGSNVRGVGTFFVTCSNLGQLFQYNFKTLCDHLPRNFYKKLRPSDIVWNFLRSFFDLCEIVVVVGLLERENNELLGKLLLCRPQVQ